MWIPPGDHYILVAERDTWTERAVYAWDQYGIPYVIDSGPHAPITWEHYLGVSTSWDDVVQRRRQLGNRYGRTAIAQLTFIEVGQ